MKKMNGILKLFLPFLPIIVGFIFWQFAGVNDCTTCLGIGSAVRLAYQSEPFLVIMGLIMHVVAVFVALKVWNIIKEPNENNIYKL